MAVVAMVTNNQLSGPALTVDPVSQAFTTTDAHKTESQVTNVGIVVARMTQVVSTSGLSPRMVSLWHHRHPLAGAASPQPQSYHYATFAW
ncbi:hypothetical protein OG21DRAFT_394628 [Imleria badia]|nr:hypothetical protein OG21DRAFT_394628 [Imleria badia]